MKKIQILEAAVNIATLIAIVVGFYQLLQAERGNNIATATLSYAWIDKTNSNRIQNAISNVDNIWIEITKKPTVSLIEYIADINILREHINGINLCVQNNYCEEELLKLYLNDTMKTMCIAIFILENEYRRRRDEQNKEGSAFRSYDNNSDPPYEFFSPYYLKVFDDLKNTVAVLLPSCEHIASEISPFGKWNDLIPTLEDSTVPASDATIEALKGKILP